LNGAEFILYQGPNGNGQFVYSWVASSNITNFDKDISPLLHYLSQNNLIPNSTYLGIVQFGTETFHATSNVTFSAQDFSLKVAKSGKTSMANGGVWPNTALILLAGLFGLMSLL